MLRSLVLVTVLGFASAFLHTDTRCHEGPAYWCSSPETAATCEATDFCQQKVWTETPVETKDVGNFVTCKACTWVFSAVESYIFTPENEKKIVQFTEKVCDAIPASYVETCKNLIETYGQQAIDTLAKKLGPEVVCKAIGQCDAKSTEAIHLLGLPKHATCNSCREMMTEMKSQNAELLAWWQNACGDVQEPTRCIEYSEFAKVLNQAVLNDNICEEMDMC